MNSRQHRYSLHTSPHLITRNCFFLFIAMVCAVMCDCTKVFGLVESLYPVDPDNGTFNEAHGNGMVGWVFSLDRPLTVTSVGWYDAGRDGLSRAFQVGLWQDLTGNFAPNSRPLQLLGSANAGITIPAGTGALLQDSWRIISLSSPLTLKPGNYELAGLDTAGTSDTIEYVQLPFNPPIIGGVANQGFFWANPLGGSSSFQVTDSDHFYAAWGFELGPMLFTSIPEPATYAEFLGATVFCIALLLRRRDRSPI